MSELQISLNGDVVMTLALEVGKSYVIGREETCDIRLDDHAISRRHVSVESRDGINWQIQKLSRHGKVLRGKEPFESVEVTFNQDIQIPPYAFSIVPASAVPTAHSPHEHDFESRRPQSELLRLGPGDGSARSAPGSADTSPGGADSDQTQIQIFMPKQPRTELPHFIIENPQGELVSLRLEGELWTIGRDDTMAQILVPDLKCSRRHLQVHFNEGEYFAEDLASTQGTELNGRALLPHQLQKLHSGDIIRIGDYKLTFELHDAKFEMQLRMLPPELLSPITTEEYQAENETNLPVFGNPERDDVVRSRSWHEGPKKFVWIAATVALFLTYILMSGSEKGNVHATSQTSQSQDPFERLTPEQKQYIMSSYNLGDTFMKRRNYDAALREFQKVHELVPSFQKSRDYEEAARHALEAVEQKRSLQEQQRKEEEVQRMVEAVLSRCRARLSSFQNLGSLEVCLAPINDLDPSNKTVEILKTQFQNSADVRDQNRAQRAAAADGIRRGEKLFQRAEDLKRRGQVQSAIAAFQAHLNANIVDPKNLKQQSRREIASLESGIKEKTDKLMTSANGYYANNQLREAGAKVEQVLLLDEQNEKARALKSKVKNDMNRRMKVIYGDSILLESLGNIDEAREKWKQIVKADLPDGEYGAKAKSKISKYGDK